MATIADSSRLLRIPEVRRQPYHRKLVAQGLINRGADAPLLLFWVNLIEGHYSHFPIACVMADVMYYVEHYPAFEEEILNWFFTFEGLIKTK